MMMTTTTMPLIPQMMMFLTPQMMMLLTPQMMMLLTLPLMILLFLTPMKTMMLALIMMIQLLLFDYDKIRIVFQRYLIIISIPIELTFFIIICLIIVSTIFSCRRIVSIRIKYYYYCYHAVVLLLLCSWYHDGACLSYVSIFIEYFFSHDDIFNGLVTSFLN